jgi:hypothetical protein
MHRKDKLFALAEDLKKKNIKLFLIQIEEAHTDKWPIGREYQPTNHRDFEDRVKRAQSFNEQHQVPYPILIDDWDNTYSNTFQAWPDKYYFVDEEKIVRQKSTYGTEGDRDGKVTLDCVDLLQQLIE